LLRRLPAPAPRPGGGAASRSLFPADENEGSGVKITYLHQYFNTPAMPGSTRSYEMARRLVAAGHDVHVITSSRTPKDGPMRRRREQIDGITVTWIPVEYHNAMSVLRRIVAFAKFAVLSSWSAMTIPTDVVFATSTPLTVAIPGIVGKIRHRVPMVFEVRDLWPELPHAIGALQSRWALGLATWLERRAYRNSAKIIALSPGMADGVARTGFPRANLADIPNGCDNDVFAVPDAAGAEFRAARPWLGDRPLVMYCGTLGKINAVGYLVDVAAAMREIDPEVRFLVIGAGAEQQSVEQRARAAGVLSETFFMEQPIAKRDVPAALNAATVCTSLFLPLPAMEANSANKFFDALAASRPIAINYGGWQRDLIDEHHVGLSLHPTDIGVAATDLAALLHDRARLDDIGAAARRLAETRFDRELLGRQFVAVLESVGPSRRR
jgi:glycosyltransferase involved in cell wall biosynthesis